MYSHVYDKKSFFEKLKLSDVWIDNFVFRLHYLVTVSIIVVYTVILTINQYAGDPIDCQLPESTSFKMDNYIDDYCYIHGTKTLKQENCKLSEDHGSTTGIGAGKSGAGCWGKDADNDACANHDYYQWVAFMLLAQAVCFYIPGGLWQHWEGGRVKESVGDNGIGGAGIQSCLNKEEPIENQAKQIARDIKEDSGKHGIWAAMFTMCEFLNLGNVIGQFYLTDWFLAGEFRDYGIKAAEFFNSADDRCDPMDQILPVTTMCNFYYYQNGRVVNTNALCVLPTNIWNQKFYFFFYYWLLFLISITSIQCIFRLLSILDSHVRDIFLVLPETPKKQRMLVAYGDWLFASLVVANLNSVVKAQVKKQFK